MLGELLSKIPRCCGSEVRQGFPSRGREASVPVEKKQFVCILDENILLPALHRQLAASQENVLLCSLAESRAAALGEL